MNKQISVPLMILTSLMLSGCGHFLVRDSYSCIGFDKYGRYDDYNAVMLIHENPKKRSELKLSKNGEEIAKWTFLDKNFKRNVPPELYAARSACIVRHDPAFAGTRMSVALMSEFTTGENLYLGWIFPAILTPFAFVWDVVNLPIQAIQTACVSQDDIDAALKDLEKARALGYSNDVVSRGWIAWPATHLDKIGYERSDREAH